MALAPGKLLLLGEHSAVYGYPAAGLPLPLNIRVSLEPRYPGSPYTGLTADPDPKVLQLIERLLGRPLDSDWDIIIHSTIPQGAGLGSSGALCTALARVLYPRLPDTDIWPLAHKGEALFHGTPSGIDTGISVFNRPLGFTFLEPGALPQLEPLSGLSAWLLVSALPRTGNTRDLVKHLAEKMGQQDPHLLSEMKILGSLAQDFIDSRGLMAPPDLGQVCSSAQTILSRWGLSHPALEEYLSQAAAWGSLGGKMSGAGGGGAFFTVYGDRETAERAGEMTQEWFEGRHISLLVKPFIVDAFSDAV